MGSLIGTARYPTVWLRDPSWRFRITPRALRFSAGCSHSAALASNGADPPGTFRPLPEAIVGKHRLRCGLCFHRGVSTTPPGHRLASLGFHPLRHMRNRKSTYISEVCLTSYAPPSGFGHPLGVLLLPDPLDRVSGPSAHGVLPFRVLLPPEEPHLFRGLGALLSLTGNRIRRSDRQPRLQSFAPFGRAVLAARAINADRRRSSPGVCISEAFSLASLLPLRVNSSFALYNHRRSKPPAYAVP